jgi:hypothetical protein
MYNPPNVVPARVDGWVQVRSDFYNELLTLAKEVAAIEKIVRIFPDKLPKDMVDVFLALGEQARSAIGKGQP